ncbi:MAG: RNA methyltransferase [Gemmatimonadaceae bacterium]
MRTLTLARDLTRRKARERDGSFVAEGIRACEELTRSALEVVGALVGPQLMESPRGVALRRSLEGRGVQVTEVTEKEFASAAATESPQGVLAIARIPRRAFDDLVRHDTLRLLVLDAVQDPGNVGTIVRTAAALGVTATIALPGTVDLWNAKVVRSAVGAHFHHSAFHASWEELQAFCTSGGVAIWGGDAHGADISTVTPPSRLALAVGNEGGGLSPAVQAAVTQRVSLPIAPAVESLNVAVAAGILLFQLRP